MVKTLVEVVTECNVSLITSGERFKAYCPFHKDDTPSFTIYPNETYYCFGCGVWGDAVKFLVELKGIPYTDALAYVGAEFKTPKADKAVTIKVQNVVPTWDFLWRVTEDYHNFLLEMPGAFNYLLNRGLKDKTIRKYKLGYTDGRVLNLMFASERKLALDTGIMNKNGFEMMSHRITIPNIIGDNQVDFIMGRTVTNDTIKYLGARIPKPLIGFHEVRTAPLIFMVEGQFDWLTLRQWGYPAICVSGNHLKPYSRLPLEDKYILYIADIEDSGEGMRAGKEIVGKFGDKGILVDLTELREKHKIAKLDINALAQFPDGESEFAEIVRSIVCNIPLSQVQLKKWLPKLKEQIPSLLT